MRVKNLDGKIFTGDADQVIRAMWKGVLAPAATIEQWMADSAQRAKDWNGAETRTTSTVEHLEDLLAAGIVELA